MQDVDFNISVGRKLFAARKERGLSRMEVGKRVDLHETTVKRYEDGDIKNLSIDKLKQFAEVLGLDPAYLMGWEDSPIGAKNAIVAAHRADPFADLPIEAQEQLEEYIEFLRAKYKIDK